MANAQIAFDYFIAQGWTPAQAAGIVGNLMQESGPNLDLNVVGDAGTAFGIAQWRGDRFANLQRFAAQNGTPWNSLETQLAFINHELGTTERRAGDALRSATTVDDATAAMISYERPQGWTTSNPRGGHGWGNRLTFANQLLGGAAPAGPQHDLGQGAAPAAPNAAPVLPVAPPAAPTAPERQPTPIADAILSVGNAIQPAAAENRPEPPRTPRLGAADFVENSRSRLAEMQSTFLPPAEPAVGQPQQPFSPFAQPLETARGPDSAFRMMFGPAKSAPLSGGMRIRA